MVEFTGMISRYFISRIFTYSIFSIERGISTPSDISKMSSRNCERIWSARWNVARWSVSVTSHPSWSSLATTFASSGWGKKRSSQEISRGKRTLQYLLLKNGGTPFSDAWFLSLTLSNERSQYLLYKDRWGSSMELMNSEKPQRIMFQDQFWAWLTIRLKIGELSTQTPRWLSSIHDLGAGGVQLWWHK